MNSETIKTIEDNLRKTKKLLEDCNAIECFIKELDKSGYIGINSNAETLYTNCNLYSLIGKDVTDILKIKLNKMKFSLDNIGASKLADEALFA